MPATNSPPNTEPIALMLCTAPTAPALAIELEAHDRGHRRLEVVGDEADDHHHDERA